MSCPLCHKATDEKFKPFCSKRCADVDLHRWFSGGYAIPSEEMPEEEELEQLLNILDGKDGAEH